MVETTGKYWRLYPPFAVASIASILMTGCTTVYNVDIDALSNPDAVQLGHSYEIVPDNPSIPSNNPQFQHARRLVRQALTVVGMYEVPEGEPTDITIGIDFGVGMRQITSTGSPMSSGVAPVTTVSGVPTTSPMTGSPGGYTSYKFRKYLSIVASTNNTGPRTELWRVEVSLVDKGDNMDFYLPILAGVASEFVATDTGEKTSRRVSLDDELVTWVQQGQ